MTPQKNFNLSNTRVEEQLNKMKEMHKRGICMFCKEGMKEYHDAPIIREKKWWLITKNDYPYEGARVHLLIAYKKHVDSIEEVSPAAMTELLDHIKWIKKEFKIAGGTFMMRFGDIKYTGASIAHLHAHIIAGYKQKKDSESIKQKIGYKK